MARRLAPDEGLQHGSLGVIRNAWPLILNHDDDTTRRWREADDRAAGIAHGIFDDVRENAPQLVRLRHDVRVRARGEPHVAAGNPELVADWFQRRAGIDADRLVCRKA